MNLSHPFEPSPVDLPESSGKPFVSAINYGHPSMPWNTTSEIAILALRGKEMISKEFFAGDSITHQIRLINASEVDMYYKLYSLFCDAFILRTKSFMPRLILFSSMPEAAHLAAERLVQLGRCSRVIYKCGLFDEPSVTSLKPLITANTVLISMPLLTTYGCFYSATHIKTIRLLGLETYNTPLHVDFTMALFEPNIGERLRDVPIVTAYCGYFALVDTAIFALHDEDLYRFKDNKLSWYEHWGDNHLGYMAIHFVLKANKTALAMIDWVPTWIDRLKVIAPSIKVLRYSDIVKRGLINESNALIIYNDQTATNWRDSLLVFSIVANYQLVNARTIAGAMQAKKEYVKYVDLTKFATYDNKAVARLASQSLILTAPSSLLQDHLRQLWTP